MIANLLSVLPVVRPLAKHALVGDHTHCKVVDGDTVVLTAHDFRRHISWRARGVLRVFGVPQTGNTKICHSEIALLVKYQVLGLDVPVQNGVLVEVLEAKQHASDEKFGLHFTKVPIFSNVIPEVAPRHEVYDEIQIVPVFKRVVHIDEEWVMQLAEELLLVHDGVHAALGDYSGLRHLLHRKKLLLFSEDDFPNFAETASSNDMLVVEVIFIYFYIERNN